MRRAASGIEFIDLCGIRPLLETAGAVPDRRLVLEHPSGWVRRLVELLDAYGELIEVWP